MKSYRADYIRRHYSLACEEGVWTARMGAAAVISGSDREAVVAQARRQWGHFFWSDEAEAFNEIFRRAS